MKAIKFIIVTIALIGSCISCIRLMKIQRSDVFMVRMMALLVLAGHSLKKLVWFKGTIQGKPELVLSPAKF